MIFHRDYRHLGEPINHQEEHGPIAGLSKNQQQRQQPYPRKTRSGRRHQNGESPIMDGRIETRSRQAPLTGAPSSQMVSSHSTAAHIQYAQYLTSRLVTGYRILQWLRQLE